MKKIKKAFSLIEVIIAASILSVTVFGVYKLIGENSKLINNSGNYFQLNSLFPVLEECIQALQKTSSPDFFTKSIGFSSKFNFGNNLNGCSIGTATGVIIDNIDFIVEGEIITKTSDYIDWELKISGDGIGISTGTFKLLK